MADAWEEIKSWLAAKLNGGAYKNWISRTVYGSFHDGTLTVHVPDEATGTWIRQEYSPLIRTAIQELNLRVSGLDFRTGASSPLPTDKHPSTDSSGNGHSVPAEPLFENTATWLNPRLTFE
ncbi:MAG: hypothetical protein JO145_16825, partial [Acidobacteriaceae bacterium]|nr:hypothetical protein [Acidobacteriaceae bacterium]